MEKNALGKGLSALIPENVKLENGESITYLKTDQIKKNVKQPRKIFKQEQLEDLVLSIKERGVLQPLLVRQKDEGYELIAGERRLRAAESLNIEKVPVIIKTASDQEALVMALIENIQREELSPIEEANAFKRLIEEFNLTQDVVAQSVGKNRATVANIMRLLSLPEEIQKSIDSEIFSMGHARALLAVKEEPKQKKLWKKILEKKLSVRELENLIRTDAQGKIKKTLSDVKDPYVYALEQDLQQILGTKVRLKSKKKRGKIEIEYYSYDDLERIMQIIKK